jgi:hypothetical protein
MGAQILTLSELSLLSLPLSKFPILKKASDKILQNDFRFSLTTYKSLGNWRTFRPMMDNCAARG